MWYINNIIPFFRFVLRKNLRIKFDFELKNERRKQKRKSKTRKKKNIDFYGQFWVSYLQFHFVCEKKKKSCFYSLSTRETILILCDFLVHSLPCSGCSSLSLTLSLRSGRGMQPQEAKEINEQEISMESILILLCLFWIHFIFAI